MKFFLNTSNTGYLRGLAAEFNESTNAVYLLGDLALGINSNEINIIIIGENIDLDYLETLVAKAQKLISREIGYAVFTPEEFKIQYPHINQEKLLPVWQIND